ncbi:MAG: ABC transporter permease [Chitinophagales bacterium]|nr:ABC transporter permease [Chitinophagales bacterium]
MFLFLLKRILLFIPTLGLVAVIAFFLSKLVPGDPADALLTMQGITPDNPRANQEYKRHYEALHLNKPLFYCSIKPDFYPHNIAALSDKDWRNTTQALLQQKIPYIYIQKYLEVRTSFLGILEEHPEEKTIWLDWMNAVRFENDMQQLSHLTTKPKPDTTSLLAQAEQLTIAIQDMQTHQRKRYYPVLHWHGTSNQFHYWIANMVQGDFGISFKDGRSVLPKIKTALSWTLLLTLLSLLISVMISVPLGMWSAIKQGTFWDKINQVIWLIFYAMPVFWLASMLIIYFTSDHYGSWLHIFPTPGIWYIPEGQSIIATFMQYSHQLILPLICLVANDIAPLSTLVRNNILEQQSKGYVLMAYAKGLNAKKTLMHHIMPNVLLPIITIIGGRLIAGISGALIIEVIFNIPGMGRLMYESIYAADWNVVFGILMILAVVSMIVLTISDVLYAWADPRIQTKLSKT